MAGSRTADRLNADSLNSSNCLSSPRLIMTANVSAAAMATRPRPPARISRSTRFLALLRLSSLITAAAWVRPFLKPAV